MVENIVASMLKTTKISLCMMKPESGGRSVQTVVCASDISIAGFFIGIVNPFVLC